MTWTFVPAGGSHPDTDHTVGISTNLRFMGNLPRGTGVTGWRRRVILFGGRAEDLFENRLQGLSPDLEARFLEMEAVGGDIG